MKTALSIPDDLYQEGERFAKRYRKSRSQLYREALKEYLAQHSEDAVTEAMDKVCEDLKDTRDDFVAEAARRILERSDW